ncbi:MAG: HAMP domain-containing sensor histidine kinase [bacterium]|nr:HAMP domain-containing sensor histidine kinase [bacterium]
MYQNDVDEKIHQLCTNNSELTDLMKQYEEENKLLLSQITHEIRNPLTLIYSTLQLIEHKNPDITQINYWSNLKDDMKDVFSLLDQLSEYNHCDTLSIQPVDLQILLTELVTSFKPYMSDKSISISVNIGRYAKPFIHSYPCDETKIKQVFTNLIKNAVEAIEDTGEIELKCLADSEHDRLLISVSNTGSTIPEENLTKIFTPFVTTKPNGSGLGLPTAKRIVLSHDGTITVISEQNKTTFTVALPLTKNNQ